MKRSVILLLILIPAVFSREMSAEALWRYEAVVQAPRAGVVEAVLPPALLFEKGGKLALELAGPDGRPRAFELYWQEETGAAVEGLSVENPRWSGRNFQWDCKVPEKLRVEYVDVRLSAPQAAGRLAVQGRIQGQWRTLAKDVALVVTAGRGHTRVALGKVLPDQLRFQLGGINAKYQDTPLGVDTVTATGRWEGKQRATVEVPLSVTLKTDGEWLHAATTLPGSGLFVETMTLDLGVQFSGAFELSVFDQSTGEDKRIALVKGEQHGLGKGDGLLHLKVGSRVEGHRIALRLSRNSSLPVVFKSWTARVRSPRLAFVADEPGVYRIRAAGGGAVALLERPSDAKRKVDMILTPGSVVENTQWQAQDLVAAYGMGGGAFHLEGYRWKATTQVPGPGYYRLSLNLEASLDPRPAALRLVFNETQVPFFGRADGNLRQVALQPVLEPDAKANRSLWTVQLPLGSSLWRGLQLKASGIFERTLVLQRPAKGGFDWEDAQRLTWRHDRAGEAVLETGLSWLKDGDRFRVVMDHGDNQPLELRGMEVTYFAPALYFVAVKGGFYDVYGGHESEVWPRYDVGLVQPLLAQNTPQLLALGEVSVLSSEGWLKRAEESFERSGWALYLVLGAVALALLGMVAWMFPKGEAPLPAPKIRAKRKK